MFVDDSEENLYIDEDTGMEEVVDFLISRLQHPIVFDDGVIVYNFHNKDLSASHLTEWAQDAESGIYAVPYQVSAVWAFMTQILPENVTKADTLVFKKDPVGYQSYENWYSRIEETPVDDVVTINEAVQDAFLDPLKEKGYSPGEVHDLAR